MSTATEPHHPLPQRLRRDVPLFRIDLIGSGVFFNESDATRGDRGRCGHA